MRGTVELFQYLNLGLYTLVAVVALLYWRRHRDQAGLWAALSFGALAVVVDAGQLLPEVRDELWEEVAVRVLPRR